MAGPGPTLRRRDTPVTQGPRAGHGDLTDGVPDAAVMPNDGTIIDRLTSVHNGRLGRLLNQLQVSRC